MNQGISLKALYEAGITQLFYGGEIVKDGDYYDLYNEAGILILCDGECIDYTLKEGNNGRYIYAITGENKSVYLTQHEFGIAAFR